MRGGLSQEQLAASDYNLGAGQWEAAHWREGGQVMRTRGELVAVVLVGLPAGCGGDSRSSLSGVGGMMWPMVPLGDLAEIVGGSTPRRDEPSYWGPGHFWATPTDLPMPEDGILDLQSTAEAITPLGLRSSSTNLLPVGTVLYSTRATIGKLAIARVPVATNQGFNNLIAKPGVCSKYLAYALQFFTPDITRLAGSTTFKEVSRSSLRGFKIPVPAESEQQRIVDLLGEADRLRRLRREADARLRASCPRCFSRCSAIPPHG